jgi:hypothetical protein
MGFYNLSGPNKKAVKASLPGTELIVSESYYGKSFNNNLVFSTTISFSSGMYGVYVSNLSENENIIVNLEDENQTLNTREVYLSPKTTFQRYIVDTPQNLKFSVLGDLSQPSIVTLTTNINNISDGLLLDGEKGGKVFLFAGGAGSIGSIVQSDDGYNWVRTFFGNVSIRSIAYNDGTYVTLGSTGDIRSSINLTTFIQRLSFGTNTAIGDVKYLNNLFVSTSPLNTVAISTNGVSWTTRPSFINAPLRYVNYAGGHFLVSNSLGALSRSTDGITWTTTLSTGQTDVKIFSFSNQAIVYSNNASTLLRSTNAVTWTTQKTNLAIFGYPSDIVFLPEENIYLASITGGYNAISTDLIYWTPAKKDDVTSQKILSSEDKIVIALSTGRVGVYNKDKSLFYVQLSKIKEIE